MEGADYQVVRAWFLAARPKTLPAAIVPVWAGCLYVSGQGHQLNWALAILTGLGAILIQVATNFFNDVIDLEKGADTPDRKGPQRAAVSGLLRPKQLYRGAGVMLILAIICGIYLTIHSGWLVILIGLPSLYLSYGYTGGPFPLAYRGMGEAFVILFFGIIAVGGTVFVQIGQVGIGGWILGLQIGCLSAVLIAVNNYRDLEEDRVASKKTIAVRFGRRVVKPVIIGFTIFPALLSWFSDGPGLFFWLVVLALFFVALELCLLRADGVCDRLLGFSALHLILFVAMRQIGQTLT